MEYIIMFYWYFLLALDKLIDSKLMILDVYFFLFKVNDYSSECDYF